MRGCCKCPHPSQSLRPPRDRPRNTIRITRKGAGPGPRQPGLPCACRVCGAERPGPRRHTAQATAERSPGSSASALWHTTRPRIVHTSHGARPPRRVVACSQRGGVGLRAAALCDRTIMRKYMRVHSYQRIRTRCEMSVLLRSGPIGCSSSSDIADPVACRRASVTLHVTRERPQHHGSLWLVYGHGGAKLHLVPRLGLIPDRRRLERRCGCTRGWGGRVDGES